MLRKFLSSTAGASFNQELATQTICVRKDCVELPKGWTRSALVTLCSSKNKCLKNILSNRVLLACYHRDARTSKEFSFPCLALGFAACFAGLKKDGLDEVWNYF